MILMIKGMNMPSGCQPCKLKRFVGNRVLSGCKPEVLYECPFCDGLFALKDKRQPSCKFKQLPAPHGRLIDADKLMKVIEENDYILSSRLNTVDRGMFTIGIKQVIDESPTIIEAEQGDG